jgi:predicted negative regulator of RcsB-dependent stress response
VAATNAAQIAHAKKVGEVSGERAAAMPSTLNTIDQFSSDVTNLLQQPGFDAIYGHIAGTNVGQAALQLSSQDAANAIAARDQVQAEAFQVAIQKMRGLGQLSNQEGLKVQNAFTRAVSHRISSPEARKAWMETLTHLDTLKKVARQEGGPNWASVLDNGAPAAPSVPTFATEAEAAAAGLPSGTRVIIGGQSGTWQ